MRLRLTVRSFCDQIPADSQARVFDSFPIIIGRSPACDYCLSDPSRYISSNHAVILWEGEQLVVEDSSANGVYVNGAAEPVGRGRKMVINHDDTLAIGDYIVIVTIELDVGATSRSDARSRVVDDDPFDGFSSFPSSATDTGFPASPATHDPFKGDEPDWTPPSESTQDPFTGDWGPDEKPYVDSDISSTDNSDDDWADWPDVNATQAPSQPAAPSAPNTTPADDFDWLPGSSEETVALADPFDEDFRPAGHNRSTDQTSDTEQPEVLAGPSENPDAPEQAIRQGLETPDPWAPAPVALTPAPSVPTLQQSSISAASPAGTVTASPTDIDDLLKAASLNLSDFSHRDSTEVLEQTGRLLAQMVDAIMVLLESRNELKNAIRSDVTTLSRKDNNPLKFSINASDALTKLLANDTDGYLQSDTAIQEAVDDLKLHQLAMLDGMKSAVKSLLLQFDPEKLARTLEKTGGLSANIPLTRDAKLWSLFCEQHDAIREEAVNNFSELFGAEFRKAYEKRTNKAGRPSDLL